MQSTIHIDYIESTLRRKGFTLPATASSSSRTSSSYLQFMMACLDESKDSTLIKDVSHHAMQQASRTSNFVNHSKILMACRQSVELLKYMPEREFVGAGQYATQVVNDLTQGAFEEAVVLSQQYMVGLNTEAKKLKEEASAILTTIDDPEEDHEAARLLRLSQAQAAIKPKAYRRGCISNVKSTRSRAVIQSNVAKVFEGFFQKNARERLDAIRSEFRVQSTTKFSMKLDSAQVKAGDEPVFSLRFVVHNRVTETPNRDPAAHTFVAYLSDAYIAQYFSTKITVTPVQTVTYDLPLTMQSDGRGRSQMPPDAKCQDCSGAQPAVQVVPDIRAESTVVNLRQTIKQAIYERGSPP